MKKINKILIACFILCWSASAYQLTPVYAKFNIWSDEYGRNLKFVDVTNSCRNGSQTKCNFLGYTVANPNELNSIPSKITQEAKNVENRLTAKITNINNQIENVFVTKMVEKIKTETKVQMTTPEIKDLIRQIVREEMAKAGTR